VAAFLLAGKEESPVDLGDTLVLVPTAGAGRAIRCGLAKRGVLSPAFKLPMDALLPGNVAAASRLEREAAWVLLLDPAKRQRFEALVPGLVALETAEDRFGVAGRFCGVCDQLAEAGFDPASPEMLGKLPEDAIRWETFGKLYREYLEVLGRYGLCDPNAERITQAGDPNLPSGTKRVVVACIPDLPPVVQEYLEALSRKGVTVDVLAWSPSGQAANLDAWGRPVAAWWKDNHPRVEEVSLLPANDPPTEAGLLLDFSGQEKDQSFGLFAAAPESAVALAQEISRRDGEAYLPGGRALAQTESSEIFLGWDDFSRGRRLRDLRVLLQKPCFLSFFAASAAKPERFTAHHALAACDRLIGMHLCENTGAAESWLGHAGRPANKAALREFISEEDVVRTAVKLLARKLDGRGMLAAVNGHRGSVDTGSFAAMELAAVAEVTAQFETSDILRQLPDDLRKAAARSDIGRKRIFPRAPAGAVEVQGWLEAFWSGAQTLIIAGCRESALPSGACEDSFLPDGAKAQLGLVTQDGRLARDAYLLSCIISSRSPAQVRLGFARFGNQGEPNRPSRLLFGCGDDELPQRSQLLFKPSPPSERADRSEKKFTLHIPEPGPQQWPPPSIRVTACKSYLECPLRFYLGNILRLRKVDADAREIPATDFGVVIHKVLEEFVTDSSLKNLRHADEIAGKLSEILDAVIPRYYGGQPSPVVRVQIENMRSRLVAAGPVEAALRAEGWETIAAEHKVTKEEQRLLGGLPVTGTMDRVDRHPEHGLRILDYKTYSQAKNPCKTHIGPRRARKHLAEADFETTSKAGKRQLHSWTDLQLPLYAWLARQIWPGDAAKGVKVGYFLLPPDGDPGKSPLQLFELDEAMQESAEKCAARIAGLVKGGHFWPPSPSSQIEFDDFKDWFMQGDPSNLIDEESARRLDGNP